MKKKLNKIRILPEILSNQIAAGEVVQRPASVVKELVENSMDAGADRITVEIDGGGKTLIRISDNGAGLKRDEAMLSIERYATSKIFAKEDLFSISTFGFRGEALPSIASVSKFSLVSRPENENIGTKVDIAGGRLAQVSDVGAPPGTMVEVRQLFFNTPARRKFLKAQATENSHISDTVAGLAMGNPDIGFRLFFNKKLVKHFPLGQDIAQRAQMILGKDVTGKLYPLDLREDGIQVSGVIANPAITRSTANRIYLFVNNRLVHDRGLVAALFQGYRGRIMKGRFPMGVVCIDLPYDQVDVNVHPTKREIKFLLPQPVFQCLKQAVDNAMTHAQSDVLAYAQSAPVTFLKSSPEKKTERQSVATKPADSKPPAKVASANFRYDLPVKSIAPDKVAQPSVQWEKPCQKKDIDHVLPTDSSMTMDPPKILGQVLGTYIVVEKENHLVLVDQHAAHERITYEALKRRHETLGIQSQDLMVPEVLELTHQEADLLETLVDDLAGLGLRIEPFGGTTFVIKAIPVLLDDKALQPLVLDMIEQLTQDRDMGAKDKWLDACLVTMACHRAIRANKPMNHEEMVKLMSDLWLCENPMHCPHGRPILVSFNGYQLEKLFKRVV